MLRDEQQRENERMRSLLHEPESCVSKEYMREIQWRIAKRMELQERMNYLDTLDG